MAITYHTFSPYTLYTRELKTSQPPITPQRPVYALPSATVDVRAPWRQAVCMDQCRFKLVFLGFSMGWTNQNDRTRFRWSEENIWVGLKLRSIPSQKSHEIWWWTSGLGIPKYLQNIDSRRERTDKAWSFGVWDNPKWSLWICKQSVA